MPSLPSATPVFTVTSQPHHLLSSKQPLHDQLSLPSSSHPSTPRSAAGVPTTVIPPPLHIPDRPYSPTGGSYTSPQSDAGSFTRLPGDLNGHADRYAGMGETDRDHRPLRHEHLSSRKHRTEGSTYNTTWRTDDQDVLEEHALRILIHLATLSPFLSAIFALYALLIALVSAFLAPFRLCTPAGSSHDSLADHLCRAYRYQLRLIFSSPAPSDPAPRRAGVWRLIAIDVLSPVVAGGIALAAWVAACFWLFAAIIGNPDGGASGQGKDDGRAAVLTVRDWWERWLEQGVR